MQQAKKAEVQAQKKAEKAAREAAEREKDSRSYKHVMQVRMSYSWFCADLVVQRVRLDMLASLMERLFCDVIMCALCRRKPW